MPVKQRWNVRFGCWATSDLLALCFRICHAGFHTCANHSKLKLAEYACHLQKRFAHGIRLTVSAIDSDGADDLQAQALFTNNINDLSKLLHRA